MVNGPESKQSQESALQLIENQAEKLSDLQKQEVGESFDKAMNKNNLEEAQIKNGELVKQSDALVDKVTQEQFKNIVDMLSYFSQAKTGFSLKIINAPGLESNGRDKTSPNNIIDTSSSQKKEIIKSFFTIPSEILDLQTIEFNKKKASNKIEIADLSNLKDLAKQYQNIQSQIIQNQDSITKYGRMLYNIKDGPVQLASNEDHQIIGKLFELDKGEQLSIENNLNMIKNKYKEYSINIINLKGYADATPVTPNGKKIIEENFNRHLSLLRDKGLDTSDLPSDYKDLAKRLSTHPADKTNKYISKEDINNTDLVSNRGFAITRAIMQLSWATPDQINMLNKASLDLDIHIDVQRGDEKTRGGIFFSGTGGNIDETPPEDFLFSNKSPEILMQTDLKIAVKIGNEIKIFRFEKTDNLKSDGSVKNSNLFAKMIDEGHTGSHANEKTTLDNYMNDKPTKYFQADSGGPVFFIDIVNNQTNNPIVEKIKNSNLKNPDSIPTVNEFLSLYNSLGGSIQETSKFQKIYEL